MKQENANRSAQPRHTRPLIRRGARTVFSVTLAAALSCMTPAAALASDEEVAATWSDAVAQLGDGSRQPYSFATSDGAASLASDAAANAGTTEPLKSKYDLRDPNGDGDRSDSVVTPVKLQKPWETCWDFATIAASESSILSESGKTAAETGLDLSELQIVSSVFRNDGAPESIVGPAQAGEGYRNASDEVNVGLNNGGFAMYVSSIVASGTGPVLEKAAPYQNAEGIVFCLVTDPGGVTGRPLYLSSDEIARYKLAGSTVVPIRYAGDYVAEDGTWTRSDWSVDESLWNASMMNLENGNILPDACVRDGNGDYLSTNEDAITAVKSEIQYYGRPSVVYYCSDDAIYNAATASHYTYDASASLDHAVTIVGWDDDYDASNFSSDPDKQPPANGAWLVKNSWGASTEDFPNSGNWGIVEDGKATGYFWLSYYDKSLEGLETLDYDIESYGENDEYYISQYDYMPEGDLLATASDTPASVANIFTAEGDLSVRTLGCATSRPDTSVTYQVYLLDDDATSPTDPEHSKLVYSFEDVYQYGGYHRASLPEDSWIAMREGQRFAVVTTQKCLDDGKWYQSAAINFANYSFFDTDGYRSKITASVQTEYLYHYWGKFYDEHIAAGDDAATAEAASLAEARSKVAEEGVKSQIANEVEQYVKAKTASGFTAKVNEGESFAGSTKAADVANSDFAASEASGSTDWSDWTIVKAAIEEKNPLYVADNASVKAFSEERSFASVDELASLDESLAQAKAVLAAAQVSADGADVYACDTWMTQAEHDAAAAAVEAAEKAIAAAGDYESELAGTTPSSDEVKAAQAALVLEAKQGSKAVPTFPDVGYSEGGWYADSATWCATHGLIVGYPDGLFGVGDIMSRAQLATMLWRHYELEAAAGYDAVMPTTKGTDAVDGVEDAQYYTAAANWAVSAGVIQGFEQEGSAKRDFAPYGEVSFEQLVSIVAKASGADYESSDLSVLDGFADKDAVSGWAAHAMAWAVTEGLVSGWDNGADNLRELKPAESVARERAAVVLANAFRSGVLHQPIR